MPCILVGSLAHRIGEDGDLDLAQCVLVRIDLLANGAPTKGLGLGTRTGEALRVACGRESQVRH